MEANLPALDIPVDFMAGGEIDYDVLRYYTQFPCKIRSAIFFMCTSGSLHATINFSQYTVRKGEFVFLVPDSYIQIHKITRNFRFYFAAFSSTFLDKVNMTSTAFEFIPAISQNPVLKLSDALYPVFADFYELLFKVTECPELSLNTETVKSVLNIIMQQIAPLYSVQQPSGKGKPGRDREIYMQFILLLHENFHKEHRISFYAEKIGITVQHFCNTVKKTTGKRATEIIDKFLLMEAKTRLRFTDMPVKNIAFELGFTNSNFFFKWFRNRTSITPLEYRNGEEEVTFGDEFIQFD
ncbi:MAG: helix-turn-helix domain-containing protein [Rikenellaceae bacterium]|nr:helix-turn-helix domain-containing protein [Rikenellaceae bacterium]